MKSSIYIRFVLYMFLFTYPLMNSFASITSSIYRKLHMLSKPICDMQCRFKTIRVADPIYDSSFKALFSDKSILKNFLSEIIPSVMGSDFAVSDVQDISTDHTDEKDTTSGRKKIIFDVFCRCVCTNKSAPKKDFYIDVEMQRETGTYFLDRMQYYVARKIADQKPSNNYGDLTPVLLIAISKTKFPRYEDAGAFFMLNPNETKPILYNGIPQKTTPLGSILCIQADVLRSDKIDLNKCLPSSALPIYSLNMSKYVKKDSSQQDEENIFEKTDCNGIYKVDTDKLLYKNDHALEILENKANEKNFPKEVSDQEEIECVIHDSQEQAAIKLKLEIIKNLGYPENKIDNKFRLALNFKTEEELDDFYYDNKYIIENNNEGFNKNVQR